MQKPCHVKAGAALHIVGTEVERLKMPEQGAIGPVILSEFDKACKKLDIVAPVRFIED